ncbi:MAG: hypothetical protein J1G04_03420 [Clostridiales bacterium]|nr:hypothetical protein [Clostridiales bacterium]
MNKIDNISAARQTENNVDGNFTRFYDNALEALASAVPEGGSVAFVGFDDIEQFLRAGYRPVERYSDAVVVRGGEREFAAARKISLGARLILVPTHAYCTVAIPDYRTTDGAFAVKVHGELPYAAVFDKNLMDDNLASIFGEIVALDLCAFDLAFGAHMRGDAPDDDVCTRVAVLVDDLTSALSSVVKNRTEAARILCDGAKRAAEIVSTAPRLLHCSGAAQVAEAVRMLYSAEDRPLGMRGETEMLLCGFVTEFYIKNIVGGAFTFPPDNNKRIDSICEYFHQDVRKACLHTTPIYPPLKMRLCEFRRNEYRAELTKRLTAVKRRHNTAFKVFKRLYRDDGFSMSNLIDRTDLGLCLALAPDVFAADSMLSFLKQTGKLDEYII